MAAKELLDAFKMSDFEDVHITMFSLGSSGLQLLDKGESIFNLRRGKWCILYFGYAIQLLFNQNADRTDRIFRCLAAI